jgi:hypothetical protein
MFLQFSFQNDYVFNYFFLPLVVMDKLVFKLKEVTNMYKGDAYLNSILFTIVMIQSRFSCCKLNISVAKMSTP